MPLINSARFPAAVATAADLLNLVDRVPGTNEPTLNATIVAGDTTIVLAAGGGAQLPADNFVISVDNEQILITSRSTDTLSVGQRGYAGTTAAGHTAGTVVHQYITAQSLNQLDSEVNAIEAYLLNSTTQTAAVTLTATAPRFQLCDATTAAFTVILPAAAARKGAIWFKKIDATANVVTIDAADAELIDGATVYSLVNQNQFVILVSDGVSKWYVFAAGLP